MTSVSTITREFCGKTFTLKASTEAWAQVEAELGVSYGEVLLRMEKRAPRLMDATALFAAFVQPQGSQSGKSIRSIMPFDDGASFMQLIDHVRAATEAAMPPPAKKGDEIEEGGKQVNPQ